MKTWRQRKRERKGRREEKATIRYDSELLATSVTRLGDLLKISETFHSKICTNIIKSILKHVIRIFGMVFYRENIYPYF